MNTTSAGPQLPQPVLHLAGDVGDHLDVPAQVAAAALPLQDVRVHLAGGQEVLPREVLVEHALVGAQVHVALGAVLQDEHLAVPVGVQGARIDVQVALQLDGGHREGLVLEQLGDRRAEYALAEAGHHRAHHRDVLVPAPVVARGLGGEELGGVDTSARLPEQIGSLAGIIRGRWSRGVGHSQLYRAISRLGSRVQPTAAPLVRGKTRRGPDCPTGGGIGAVMLIGWRRGARMIPPRTACSSEVQGAGT
jgi:hypothetical protein